MSKKGIEAIAKKIDEYYAQFPDWYWKYGLHDAFIISILELQLTPDYKTKHPKRNCLEILLDSKNAMYENGIKIIHLYNYKIKTMDFNISEITDAWWLSDIIEKTEKDKYMLTLEVEQKQGVSTKFVIEFETAEIERG